MRSRCCTCWLTCCTPALMRGTAGSTTAASGLRRRGSDELRALRLRRVRTAQEEKRRLQPNACARCVAGAARATAAPRGGPPCTGRMADAQSQRVRACGSGSAVFDAPCRRRLCRRGTLGSRRFGAPNNWRRDERRRHGGRHGGRHSGCYRRRTRGSGRTSEFGLDERL